ncbi:MAG: phosphoribosylaminoimidazolesuccinocarboxamide synthase [Archaeoglobus sp.]|uniref:phosphoribosylaminoimidazolesuccinocarboxamide synthase n=1 Tax=Archaeoglobus sp. TaxID=1872626 RepID=UPI001DE1A980|nr:phosphoribosylaminoimidazolesuccinocarboxamide synthase [Archaeoglobus sp.]MBO8179479.1 phosphoribosylaminoimidazolesuccinocarboxamide synthase [Archaeoglobus sp.]
MGSVKDLIVLREPTDKPGLGRFIFSDRYSVFDYGEMPDKIEGKGKALCMVSAFFFEKLEEEGIKTHYVGLVEDGKVKSFDEVGSAVNEMEIKLVRVVKPESGYSIFKKLKGNFLIPLEIIYRNSIPEGSSLLRRIERGEVKPEDFGLSKIEAGMRLEKPIIDFSTKLEDVDRYLSHAEAKEISGLTDDEFEALKELVVRVNEIITREVGKAGLTNEDGKIEVALDEERNLMVVDAVGTPDECRFSMDGFEVSKELLRKYYRKTEWYEKVKQLKGKEGWREAVGKPPSLPEEVKEGISNLYKAFCNEIVGKRLFDAPRLKEVISHLKEVLE